MIGAATWQRFAQAARAWGPWGVSLCSLAVALGALFMALIVLPGAGVDTTPVSDDVTLEIAPATGIDSLDALDFCNDPRTAVRAFPAPDTAGTTYQLTRVRDQRSEAVVVVLGPDKGIVMASSYYDSELGQQSRPAIVSDKARECIEKKAER